MSDIVFSNEEKELLVDKLKLYFDSELDQEISQFEAEFLLDFFAEKIGVYFYNKGVNDAQSLISLKVEDVVYELEKTTEFSK